VGDVPGRDMIEGMSEQIFDVFNADIVRVLAKR